MPRALCPPLPPGNWLLPQMDGTLQLTDNTILLPDGTLQYPDGSLKYPDGSVRGGLGDKLHTTTQTLKYDDTSVYTPGPRPTPGDLWPAEWVNHPVNDGPRKLRFLWRILGSTILVTSNEDFCSDHFLHYRSNLLSLAIFASAAKREKAKDAARAKRAKQRQ